MEKAPEMIIPLIHEGSNEKISIIVVHHNKPEYLNLCLQSLHIMSNLNNYEVIVVDNNSNKETQDYLDVLEKQDIKVLRLKENMYWSAAANKAVTLADPNSKYLLFLHDDVVILNQAWMDILVNAANGRNSGLVGIEMGEYFLSINNQRIMYPKEWCLLITRDCWNDAGPWNENLPLVGAAFILSIIAQKKGYNPIAIANSLIHHYKAPVISPNLYSSMAQDAMGVIGKLIPTIV